MNKGEETTKKWIQILLILLLFFIQIAGAVNYPHLTKYVNDNANIIDDNYKQKITELAERIEKNTTVEIAVLTIESLEGDTPENYALQTFRQNGVGKKDNNNGLLILVAKDDRKYRFEVGYGLEGTIPDAMKVPIGDKIITPNFKNGEYGKGIYESMLVVEGLATNDTAVVSKYLNPSSGVPDWLIILIIIIVVIVILVVLIAVTDGGGGSGGSWGGGGWGGGSSGGDSGSGGGFGGGSSGGGGFGGGW